MRYVTNNGQGIQTIDLIDVAAQKKLTLGWWTGYGMVYSLCGPKNLSASAGQLAWFSAARDDYTKFELDLSDDSCGIACDNGVIRNVLSDNGTCSNNRILTNFNSGE